MTDQTVTPDETADQPDHFAEVAAALYRIADDIVTLTGSGLPKIGYIQLSMQPGRHHEDDLSRRAVDAVTSAVLGHPGQVEEMGNGTYHYSNGDAAELVGPVGVRIMQAVSAEWAVKNDVAAAEAEVAEREAELERARARVAELRGLSYSREPESTVVTPVPAGVDGHPEGRAAGIVPEPIAKHYEARGWTGEFSGGSGVECACGVGFDGFDSLAQASELLTRHIVDEAHADALFDDGQRAKAAVVADLRAGEHGRVMSPNLAQFLAGKEYRRREAAHFLGLTESAEHYPAKPPVHLEVAQAKTMCGLALIDLAAGAGWTNDHDAVTCKACIDKAPF